MCPDKLSRCIAIAAIAWLLVVAGGCGGDGGTQQTSNGFSDALVFNQTPAGADAVHGRAVFGIAADGVSGDSSQALFVGFSNEAGQQVTSNGRTCFSCHRPQANFMLNPLLPLDQHIPADDPLIAPDAVLADSAGNPSAPALLNDFGLVLIRPNRFNFRSSDPRFQAIAWRKVPTNLNTVFAHGFLHDLRAADIEHTDLGAAMSHTQDLNLNHDDMIPMQSMEDLAAFQFTLFTEPTLQSLAAGPSDPGYQGLANDPFATVPVTTEQEQRGEQAFQEYCFSCHNVPNVFNNRSHRDPALGIPIGEGFNIGVAEANMLNLDFRNFDPQTGDKQVVNLPLVNAAGQTVVVPLTQDPGLALITGRLDDLGKFKVPQLRNLRLGKPYFHDCSAPDLEAVIAYFNSPAYNNSPDGRRFPISLSAQEQTDLLAFLNLL
jgi:cytochrome c peroxidase